MTRSTYVADRLIDIEHALASGDWPAARQAAAAAAAAAPQDAHVLHSSARLCELADMPDEALAQWLHAVAIDPSMGVSWSAIGTILSRGFELKSPHLIALMAFSQAARAEPDWLLPCWHLALLYHALGHPEAAQSALDRCRRILAAHGASPKNAGTTNVHNRAYMHLSLGELDAGFACYEERLRDVGHVLHERAQHRPPIDVPRWVDPERVPESVVIFHEQGAGDMVMCLRYAITLARHGVRVLFETSPALLPYFEDRLTPHGVEVLALDAPLPWTPAAYVWAMSLPGLMGVLPCDAPARQAGDRRRYVAFAWQGSRAHRADRVRSCPPELLQPLVQLVADLGYSPIALNPGEPIPAWIRDAECDRHIASFRDTAAILDTCAAVVSVDTALVHIAGAEGVPTFALLAALPDWRWGLMGSESPWYRTVRLVRQPTIGDWEAVIERVKEQLPGVLIP